MPVRSLNSSILKWPNREKVEEELKKWIEEITQKRKDIIRIGYFGSYARGDFGVGSDLDLIIILEDSSLPFERRGIEWDVITLPVPVDPLIYTLKEWEKLNEENSPFHKRVNKEVIWIFPRE